MTFRDDSRKAEVPQHWAVEPLGKTMEVWERPKCFSLSPPPTPCPVLTKHQTTEQELLPNLWPSELPLFHPHILQYFCLKTCQCKVPCLLSAHSNEPRTGAQLSSATCPTLGTCRQVPVGSHPRTEAQLRRIPLQSSFSCVLSILPLQLCDTALEFSLAISWKAPSALGCTAFFRDIYVMCFSGSCNYVIFQWDES